MWIGGTSAFVDASSIGTWTWVTPTSGSPTTWLYSHWADENIAVAASQFTLMGYSDGTGTGTWTNIATADDKGSVCEFTPA